MPRGGFHPPYPSELKAGTVRLVREGGRPISEVAKGLGVTTESARSG
jgi:transposase-like protein